MIKQKFNQILAQIDKSTNVANQWILTQMINELKTMPEIDPASIKIHGSIGKNKATGAYIIRLSKSTDLDYGSKITCTFRVTVSTQSKQPKNIVSH
ncbi:MAG: hypothetical protein HWD61_14815 [Parachlamydiaceae bacterium]|nr:MAG: hypothetical protein HWD61_14815 [Parachlamydiaceae bacterium]